MTLLLFAQISFSFHTHYQSPFENIIYQPPSVLLDFQTCERHKGNENTNLDITKCSFQGLSTDDRDGGAAILCKNSYFIVKSTQFLNCKALKGTGGAIYIEENFNLPSRRDALIQSSYFEQCESLAGGAIFSKSENCDHSKLTINLCHFKSNIANDGSEDLAGYGGGILIGYSRVEITNCIFEKNYAPFATNIAFNSFLDSTEWNAEYSILIDNCTLEFYQYQDCYFSVYFLDSKCYPVIPTVTVKNSKMINTFDSEYNFHFDSDCGVAPDFSENNCVDKKSFNTPIDGYYTELDQCPDEPSIPENPEKNEYQCPPDETNERLYFTIKETPTVIKGCRFKLQDRQNQGGAIYSKDSQMTITDCTFDTCSSKTGGAIYFNMKIRDNTIENCIFQSCTSICGGAIYAVVDSASSSNSIKIIIDFCEFKSNIVPYKDLPSLSLDYDGGAIYLENYQLVEIKNSIFENNAADDGTNIAIHSQDIKSSSKILIDNCSLVFSDVKHDDATCKSSVYISGNELLNVELKNSKIVNTFTLDNKAHFDISSNSANFKFDENNCVDLRKGETPLSTSFNMDKEIANCYPSTSTFTPSSQFTKSFTFSLSTQFSKSFEFSESTQFTKSSSFSVSSFFSESLDFSNSNSLISKIIDKEEPQLPPTDTDPITAPINNDDKNQNTSGNKGTIPTYAIGILVAIAVVIAIIVALIIFFSVKQRRQKPQQSNECSDDDKIYEMSMSKVSVESNFEQDLEDDAIKTNGDGIEDLDPFEKMFQEA